jgi:competence protein ComEC
VLDPVLLVGLALLGGGAVALAPIAASVASVAVLLMLRRTAPRWRIAIAVLAITIGALRGVRALEAAKAIHGRSADLLTPPSRCELRARIVTSPVVLRGHGTRGAEARVDIEVEHGSCGTREVPKGFRARLYGAPEETARGDELDVVADLGATQPFENVGVASPWAAIARSEVAASGRVIDARLVRRARTIASLIDNARASVRARIEATYHPEAAALGRALVLGETNLDPADDEAFRTSGLAHLLAVSGTHLVLGVVSFFAALRALLVRVASLSARLDVGRIAAFLAAPAAWAYADFAGGGGSAKRAAVMVTAGLLARALGARANAPRALAWSLIAGAVSDPLAIADVSFALSAGATAGLLLWSRPLASRLAHGPKPIKKALTAISATLAAMAPCAPLLAMLAPTLPVLGVLANVIAGPIGELAALPVCLAHALLAWAPPIERGAALIGSGALLLVRAIARVTAAAPVALRVPPPTAAQLSAVVIAGAAALVARSTTWRRTALASGVVAVAVLELCARRSGAPHAELRVSALDVGQGDATLVDLPDGRSMLIDGGGFVGSPIDPGTRVLLPVLRERRRSRIDIVVLSHPHPDHFGGLVTALPELEVGEFWDTGQGEERGAGERYAALLAGLRARGIPIRRPRDLCGVPHRFGDAVVDVLAPCPQFDPDRGENDNSFVLRVRFGRRSALLVGDAEQAEEATLLATSRDRLHADLLKVGHHGSRTSSGPAFLEAVSPELAVISCGVRNRFGHPHPTALAALEAHGVQLVRTDRGGEVVWSTDGSAVTVERPAASGGLANLLRAAR